MRHFDELLRRLPPETERTQGVCFYEYLVWLRRLRSAAKETWRIFHKADVEGSRRLSVARVGRLAELLGFTLVGDVVGELLGEVGVPDLSEGLDFGAVLRFVRACRARHGLSGREREEYLAAFQKFDTGNRCELTTSQVLNLLRHMGQTVRVDEVYGLIDMVDFNKNAMDPDEFLTLMTLMREKEVAHAQKIFDSLRAGAPVLPKEQLAEALTLASEKPPLQAVLEEMLAKVTFDEFWGMPGRLLGAGLPPDRGDLRGTRRAACVHSIGELIVMLSGSKFPVNTAPGRRDLLRRLEAARAQAVAAGVPEAELGPGDGEEVAFYTCVHLVRGIVREAEMAEMAREEEVLAQTRFTSDEAAEFRLVFMEIAQRGRGKRPSIGLGGLLDELTTQPAIGEHDMMNMLRTMGMRVSPNQLQELNSKIREATASGKRAGAEVDFVCFLRLISKRKKTDYAGVNTAAALASAAAPPAPKGAPRALDRSSRVQARALVKGAA
ncbi:unnamed protein product [Prorocentrum cordatum]|uniref:Calmodulin n=1 Tax=Prorocentrum cordatum TaxID=2364126 RepID=A0ABN9XSL7_9DINO|nr:unnamed protein product [Polarella glacialis]